MAEKIDLHALARELEFDPDEVEQMAAMFFKSTARALEALEAAVANDDLVAIYKAAHSIKGSAATLHLTRLQAFALEMETAGRNGVRIDYRAAARKLGAMIRAIETEYPL